MRTKSPETHHMRARAVLVLDLDHTLVHSVPRGTRGVSFALEHFDVTLSNGVKYTTYVRPHLKTLLTVLEAQRDWMRTIVWTAGTREYATAILDGLGMRNVDAYTRDDAYVLPSGRYVKNLGRIARKYGTHDVLLVDDDAVHKCPAANEGRVRHAPAFVATYRRAVRDRFLHTFAMEIAGVAAQGRAAFKI